MKIYFGEKVWLEESTGITNALNYTHESVLEVADKEDLSFFRLVELRFCGLG